MEQFKNCSISGWPVALSPKIGLTEKIEQRLKSVLDIDVKYFDKNDEIDEYVRADDYGKIDGKIPLCFGVVFDSSSKGNWNYQMRWNVSFVISFGKEMGLPSDHLTTAMNRIDFLSWYLFLIYKI